MTSSSQYKAIPLYVGVYPQANALRSGLQYPVIWGSLLVIGHSTFDFSLSHFIKIRKDQTGVLSSDKSLPVPKLTCKCVMILNIKDTKVNNYNKHIINNHGIFIPAAYQLLYLNWCFTDFQGNKCSK